MNYYYLLINLFAVLTYSLNYPITLTTKDACSIIANQSIIDYDSAIQCYSLFKINNKIQNQTITTLQRTLNFYIFKDFYKNQKIQGSNYFIKLNLLKELENIKNETFLNEMEFQLKLMKLFIKLKDGHTNYLSNCFTLFQFKLPFPLKFNYNNNNNLIPNLVIINNIQHDNNLIKFWESKIPNFNLTLYENAQVLKINQEEPINYLIKYSNEYLGLSKDLSTRLNYLLSRYYFNNNGELDINYGQFISTNLIPNQKELKFQLKLITGEVIELLVPYAVINPMGYNDFNSLNEKYCQSDFINLNEEEEEENNKKMKVQPKFLLPFDKLEDFKSKMEISIKIIQPYKNINLNIQPKLNFNQLSNNNNNNKLVLLYKSNNILSYQLTNNVGVLVITTFSIEENLFYNQISTVLLILKEKKITKLILDLSDNGGGTICLGYHLIQSLVNDINYFPTDMITSNLLRYLSLKEESGFLNPIEFNNLNNLPINNSTYFNEIISKKLFIQNSYNNYYNNKNIQRNLTNLFQERCGPNPILNSINTFSFKQIQLITNGICFSTCSLIANIIQYYSNNNNKLNQPKLITTTYNGLPNYPSMVSSIPGGSMYDLNTLLLNLDLIQPLPEFIKKDELPLSLPRKGKFTFTLREAYPFWNFNENKECNNNNNIPLEFLNIKANHHLYLNNEHELVTKDIIWFNATQFFED